MLRRPRKTYAVLAPLVALTFLLSAVGRDSTAGEGGLYYVGAVGWVAFCILLLTTLVFSLVVGLRLIGRRSSHTPGRAS